MQASSSSFRTYRERNDFLSRNGFGSYHSYLQSDLWAWVRSRVFAMHPDGARCFFCKKEAKHIHHTEYTPTNMMGKSLGGLITICAECHQFLEFDNGRKVHDFQEIRERHAMLLSRNRRYSGKEEVPRVHREDAWKVAMMKAHQKAEVKDKKKMKHSPYQHNPTR